MTLANALTSLRLLCAPIIGYALLAEEPWGLWVFAFAAATDLLDGLAARTISRPTATGALLDPIADKVLLMVAFPAAALAGYLPVWLASLVIFRDVLQAAATGITLTLRHRRLDPEKFQPTRMGKYATFMQVATIIGVLLAQRFPNGPHHEFLPPVMLLCTVLTITAGLQYVVLVGRRVPRGLGS